MIPPVSPIKMLGFFISDFPFFVTLLTFIFFTLFGEDLTIYDLEKGVGDEPGKAAAVVFEDLSEKVHTVFIYVCAFQL